MRPFPWDIVNRVRDSNNTSLSKIPVRNPRVNRKSHSALLSPVACSVSRTAGVTCSVLFGVKSVRRRLAEISSEPANLEGCALRFHSFLRESAVVPIPTNFYIIPHAHAALHALRNFFSLPPPGKALSIPRHEPGGRVPQLRASVTSVTFSHDTRVCIHLLQVFEKTRDTSPCYMLRCGGVYREKGPCTFGTRWYTKAQIQKTL